jgi:hypothetical protein
MKTNVQKPIDEHLLILSISLKEGLELIGVKNQDNN